MVRLINLSITALALDLVYVLKSIKHPVLRDLNIILAKANYINI